MIVNEAGASVYSTSQIGREELPEFDATLRSAISIGRRLQDPLAELVKIEPQNIGVGLYQHDVNPKQLKETLEAVISSCVNFVGVDLNTASVPLLRHVSGLNQLTARRIVDYRKDKGTFATREQLMEVDGVGPATYTQAAGFLKIPEGVHPLDRTWIHPESYAIATLLLERFGKTPEVVRNKQELPELHRQLEEAAASELAKELQVGEFTLRDIVEALGRPERDPRDDLPKPIFKKGILKLEDLIPGMELKGTVLNVVDFGAFVDIGLKDSGLVHISQLANRYIKTPHDVVSVGDVVTVWVMSVDQERKRVSLTMVKPGTERQRGAAQGGQRRGQGGGEQREGQAGQGQGRRDRARPPRPSGSALTSPPVGAAPIAALAEPPARRPDRDRGGAPGSQGHAGPTEGGAGQGPGPGPVSGQAFPGKRPGPGFPGPAGSGRGGPRGGPFVPGPGGARPGPGRQERPQGQRGPSRPSRPSPPPPPLSKEALSGSVPLRTFGQLKQLWEARVDPTPEELAAEAAAAAAQTQAVQPQGEPSEVAIPPGDSSHPEHAQPESAPSAEPNSGENDTR
ncbi:MAG TPA: helix-hairpin-helix domain-containing protein [Candidatus Methylomirabilis sp.]|nr:helix-hairpin-helix domain-containing protein [Candidatus Methylomirabilis sp.]